MFWEFPSIHFCEEVAQLKPIDRSLFLFRRWELSISAKKWPNWNGSRPAVSGVRTLLSISAKKWPNWNSVPAGWWRFTPSSIHFCEEVAQLKHRRRPNPILVFFAIHFCEEVAQLKHSAMWLARKTSLRSIHFCEEVAQLKQQMHPEVHIGEAYPFLRRSGPIETFCIYLREISQNSSIHFCEEVAQLKPVSKNINQSHNFDLSISAKKWPNWNPVVPVQPRLVRALYPFLRRSGPIETLREFSSLQSRQPYPFLRRSGPIETIPPSTGIWIRR